VETEYNNSVIDKNYIELEEQYKALLNKFAYKAYIPGIEKEDIYQELRLTLSSAQKKFDPNKNTKFITYLYGAFNSKLRQLYRDTQGRKKHIPNKAISYFGDENFTFYPSIEDSYSKIDLLTGLCPEAYTLATLIMEGANKRKDWVDAGMTNKEIKTGIQYLKQALQGGI
jgi:RNA polymerase sigma factor (sigma-70 family)